MSCRYAVACCEEDGTVRYGVSARFVEKGERIELRFDDLSGDREEMDKFVRKITAGRLSPFQLRDAVEDYLSRRFPGAGTVKPPLAQDTLLARVLAAAERALRTYGAAADNQ